MITLPNKSLHDLCGKGERGSYFEKQGFLSEDPIPVRTSRAIAKPMPPAMIPKTAFSRSFSTKLREVIELNSSAISGAFGLAAHGGGTGIWVLRSIAGIVGETGLSFTFTYGIKCDHLLGVRDS